MKQTVDHGFALDGEGPVRKFVTIEQDGGYHTLLHRSEDERAVRSHDALMVDFLKSRGIAPEDADVSKETLLRFDGYCVGGGRDIDGILQWSSTTLQHALGRHSPMETDLADRLIDEVREFVRGLL